MEQQNFWYIIPSRLVESGDHMKALLYGLISSLTNKEGFCWATNQFMADKLGMKSDKSVSRRIQELEKEGWINVEIDKPSGNKRYINLCINVCIKEGGRVSTGTTSGTTVPKGSGTGVPISNINNSIKSSSSKNSSCILLETLLSLFIPSLSAIN